MTRPFPIHVAPAALVAIVVAPLVASANPGLLRKHGPMTPPPLASATLPAGAVGQPLPVATATGVAGASATVPGVGSAAVSVVPSAEAVAGVAMASPGVGIAATVSGVGTIECIAVDPGMGVAGELPVATLPSVDGSQPGPHVLHPFHPWMEGAGPMPIVGVVPGHDGAGEATAMIMTALPPGGAGGGDHHHQAMALPMGALRGDAGGLEATSMGTGGIEARAGRTLAGGLPNRAAGLRAESIGVVGHQGRGRAVAALSPVSGAATGDDGATAGVVHAGGVPGPGDGAERGRSAAAHARAPGLQAVPPGAAVAPRWRDRLRIVWPGASPSK